MSIRWFMGSTTTSVYIVVSTTITMCPNGESLHKSNGSLVFSPHDEGSWCRSLAFQVGPIFPDFLSWSMRYVLENCQVSRLCSSQVRPQPQGELNHLCRGKGYQTRTIISVRLFHKWTSFKDEVRQTIRNIDLKWSDLLPKATHIQNSPRTSNHSHL